MSAKETAIPRYPTKEKESNTETMITALFHLLTNTDFFLKTEFIDVKRAYTTFSLTEAVGIMNKYGVDYVYLSPKSKEYYQIENLKYLDEDFFSEIYSNKIKVYRLLCKMEELK